MIIIARINGEANVSSNGERVRIETAIKLM